MIPIKTSTRTTGYTVAVIGMGYVGIPEALIIANSPSTKIVYGIQRDSPRSGHKLVDLNVGILPFKDDKLEKYLKTALSDHSFCCTDHYDVISECDVVIIAVQTPTDSQCNPEMINLYNIIDEIKDRISDETLIIISSTIPPGTTEYIHTQLLTSRKVFYLAHVPERVMPGKLVDNHFKYERIVGAFGYRSEEVAATFYNRVYGEKSKLFVTTAVNAEIIKTSENAVRDVQIAIANTIAMICEHTGGNYYEVKRAIDGIRDVPRCLLLPGGVGGPCLTKDGYLLTSEYGGTLFEMARDVNNQIPEFIYCKLYEKLQDEGVSLRGAKIAIFGLSYLPNASDTRNSPTNEFIRVAKDAGISDIRIYDPHCGHDTFIESITDADAIVVMTAHSAFNVHWSGDSKLMKNKMNRCHKPIFVDGRNVLQTKWKEFVQDGWNYSCIGRGDIDSE